MSWKPCQGADLLADLHYRALMTARLRVNPNHFITDDLLGKPITSTTITICSRINLRDGVQL